MAKRAFGSSGGVQEPTGVNLVCVRGYRHRRQVTSGTSTSFSFEWFLEERNFANFVKH